MLAGGPLAAGSVELSSYAPLLVPAATAFVGWLAFLGARRGGRVEESQQQARNRIDERVQVLAELQAVNERLAAENTRLLAGRDATAKTHRGELARAKEECRRQVEALAAALDTLRTVVLDEVARSAAGQVVEGSRRHVDRHEYDQSGPDGAP